MSIKSRINEFFFSKKWRKLNTHNETYSVGIFNEKLVTVGRKTYGRLYVSMFNEESELRIGNFCSIGPNVVFLLSSDHASNHLSTYPFKVKYGHAQYEGVSKGDIVVDDDVWIGYGSIILSGVHIGQGAIIAAGSIVTKDVPPYAIMGGNPARVIKYRFNEEIVAELLKFDFSKLSDNQIVSNMDELYTEMDSTTNLHKILQ